MGKFPLALTLAASLLVFTDLPQQMKQVFDMSILAGRQLATAGDMRSISTMLDVYALRHGVYPAEDRFGQWMAATFKESPLKEQVTDHWGHPFVYTVFQGRKGYLLQSGGADGVIGTDDDMWVTGP